MASTYFNDYELLKILKEMENIYYILQEQQIENHGIKIGYMGSELQDDINLLDERFQEVIKLSFKMVGDYIRKNPEKFVYIIN